MAVEKLEKIGLAVKERQLAHRIVAWSRRPASRVKCAAQPWCTRVSDTAEEAEGLARCRDLGRLLRDKGEIDRFPSVEEALSYAFTEAELDRIRERRAHQFLGTPTEVKTQLEALAERCGVDELVILSITPDVESRLTKAMRRPLRSSMLRAGSSAETAM